MVEGLFLVVELTQDDEGTISRFLDLEDAVLRDPSTRVFRLNSLRMTNRGILPSERLFAIRVERTSWPSLTTD